MLSIVTSFIEFVSSKLHEANHIKPAFKAVLMIYLFFLVPNLSLDTLFLIFHPQLFHVHRGIT